MPDNISRHLTGNHELDLELIDKEIQGCYIAIISYIILIASAKQDRLTILEESTGFTPTSTATELAALSSYVALTSSLILGEVAFERLNEIEKNIASGITNASILPNIEIANGYVFSIIGNMLKVSGTVRKVKEQANTSIL
ncbi:hypothetical protein [Clostridium thermobutyricum]|uniref:Uncharacterized protein n=1 Tax=Clostridium thermobutyricum DSM 4928 TaxID=1121339 RepID=A0A1V4SLG9_9CLOT|nr:hypothetical protein [Clostridium thermobutyricum]OPX44643.1 hypothetical protein CLTHE_31670 [Clostridium thermobutyricum DSM 4928]